MSTATNSTLTKMDDKHHSSKINDSKTNESKTNDKQTTTSLGTMVFFSRQFGTSVDQELTCWTYRKITFPKDATHIRLVSHSKMAYEADPYICWLSCLDETVSIYTEEGSRKVGSFLMDHHDTTRIHLIKPMSEPGIKISFHSVCGDTWVVKHDWYISFELLSIK